MRSDFSDLAKVLFVIGLLALVASCLHGAEAIGPPKGAVEDDPWVHCTDENGVGSWHRKSEWKGKPFEYPRPALEGWSMVVPFRAAGGPLGGYSNGPERTLTLRYASGGC